jgi:hypothetical protein
MLDGQSQSFEGEPDARRRQHEVGDADDERRHGTELRAQARGGEDHARSEHGKRDDEDAVQRLRHQRGETGDHQQQRTAVERQRRIPDPVEPRGDEQRLTQQCRHLQLRTRDDVIGEDADGDDRDEEDRPELVVSPWPEQRQTAEQQRPTDQCPEHRDVRVRRPLPRHRVDQIRRDRHRREDDAEAVRPGMDELAMVLPQEPRAEPAARA